jgi:hypothetical protein
MNVRVGDGLESNRYSWASEYQSPNPTKSIIHKYGRSLLFDQLEDVPPIRLVSRTTIWTIDPGSVQDAHQTLDRWRESWSSNIPVNGEINDDPTAALLDSTWNPENGSFWIDFAPTKASVQIWCIDGATTTRQFVIAASQNRQWSILSNAH